jgi:hypothetical protein
VVEEIWIPGEVLGGLGGEFLHVGLSQKLYLIFLIRYGLQHGGQAGLTEAGDAEGVEGIPGLLIQFLVGGGGIA